MIRYEKAAFRSIHDSSDFSRSPNGEFDFQVSTSARVTPRCSTRGSNRCDCFARFTAQRLQMGGIENGVVETGQIDGGHGREMAAPTQVFKFLR
jgi:hypothetical protein